MDANMETLLDRFCDDEHRMLISPIIDITFHLSNRAESITRPASSRYLSHLFTIRLHPTAS